jgi:hypothetical protein
METATESVNSQFRKAEERSHELRDRLFKYTPSKERKQKNEKECRNSKGFIRHHQET